MMFEKNALPKEFLWTPSCINNRGVNYEYEYIRYRFWVRLLGPGEVVR